MANQAATTAPTWDYEYPLPSWITNTGAKSRIKTMERAAMIESLGDVIPSELGCSKCRSNGWSYSVILTQKHLRCSRCTNLNISCSLKQPHEKEAVESHFEISKRAIEDGVGELARGEPEEENLEVDQEEVVGDGDDEENDKEEESEDEDEDEDDEDEEDVDPEVEVEEEGGEDEESSLKDEEEGMEEDERLYYEQQNLLRDSLISYLSDNNYGEDDIRRARDKSIPPFERE